MAAGAEVRAFLMHQIELEQLAYGSYRQVELDGEGSAAGTLERSCRGRLNDRPAFS